MNRSSKRPDPAEVALEALSALAVDADRHEQNTAVSAALAHSSFRVVARAAALAAERSLREQVPELLAAWPRFLKDGAKKDPQCQAKVAIAAALLALECDEVEFWLAGIRTVQLEPTWGRSIDTAVDVRCNCALGLVNSRHRRAIIELTSLLNDAERRVRAGAVRAISCGDPAQAEPLLRFKVEIGDEDAEVMGECFGALLAIAPEESMPLVGSRLADPDEAVRDYAALALGESRHPLALEELKAAWAATKTPAAFRGVLARAAALHRSEAAFEWLINRIENGDAAEAAVAADALSVYERNGRLMQRVEAALAGRSDSGMGR